MKLIFLGGSMSKSLSDWLTSVGEDVIYTEGKISVNNVRNINPDFIISYNYRYIISEDIIEFMNNRIINLHISYLPYNKGAYPNIWSFLENTPKGVTIHYVDKGIDTGDIIIKKKIFIDENKETLKSSYEILHTALQEIFKKNWKRIKNNEIKTIKNKGGTMHYKSELSIFKPLIKEEGWDTTIKELKKRYEFLKNK